jgi:hypothetical protein
MTAWLSGASAVIALVALAITLRREWLDRPRLTVTVDPTTSPDGSARLIATAENKGRQPTTVRSIGLTWSTEPPGLPGRNEMELLFNNPWSRVRLDPGDATQVAADVVGWPPAHVDTPMRAYAEYVGGRRVWQEPIAHYRALLKMGWRPPAGAPSELYELPASTPRAKPVIPRWQLWRPRHLRRATPTKAFPFSAEQILATGEQLRSEAGPR